MKTKRILALLLSVVMLMSLLAACGQGSGDDETNPPETTQGGIGSVETSPNIEVSRAILYHLFCTRLLNYQENRVDSTASPTRLGCVSESSQLLRRVDSCYMFESTRRSHRVDSKIIQAQRMYFSFLNLHKEG